MAGGIEPPAMADASGGDIWIKAKQGHSPLRPVLRRGSLAAKGACCGG